MPRRWERYWFEAGGRYSLAIVRTAIAVAVWLSLDTMAATWLNLSSYRPVGLWMLAGHHAPALGLVEALWVIARLSTVAMAIGAMSRLATVISFASTALLAGLYYSAFPTWSHEYNVVLLAQLALIGARSGDALAVDALVRRDRRSEHGYQWSLRLAQIAVALMFASALFHKLWSGGVSLDWALSDNLRNQLVVHFDASGLERTRLAQWMIDDAWRFRTAALANLVAQGVPLVACFLVRRPRVRIVCGAVFVLEVIGLGLVMNLWNWQWLPLVAVFVDWEWLVRRLPRESAPVAPRIRHEVSAYAGAFVVLAVATSFVPRLDQRLNLYPFTGYAMFASIRARSPYDRHAPYTFDGGYVEIVAPEHASPAIELALTRYYRKLFRVRDRERMRARMRDILASARRMFPSTTGVRLYYTIFEVPAYPAPARADRIPIALLGELGTDGSFRSLLGRARYDGREIVLTPGEPVDGPVSYYADTLPTPHVLAGLRAIRPSGRAVAYVLEDGARRWLIYEGR